LPTSSHWGGSSSRCDLSVAIPEPSSRYVPPTHRGVVGEVARRSTVRTSPVFAALTKYAASGQSVSRTGATRLSPQASERRRCRIVLLDNRNSGPTPSRLVNRASAVASQLCSGRRCACLRAARRPTSPRWGRRSLRRSRHFPPWPRAMAPISAQKGLAPAASASSRRLQVPYNARPARESTPQPRSPCTRMCASVDLSRGRRARCTAPRCRRCNTTTSAEVVLAFRTTVARIAHAVPRPQAATATRLSEDVARQRDGTTLR
jgi:hypothetical protein